MGAEAFVARPPAVRFEPAGAALDDRVVALDPDPVAFSADAAGFAARLRAVLDVFVDDFVDVVLDVVLDLFADVDVPAAACRAALFLAGVFVAGDFEVVPAPRLAVDFFFAAPICFTSRRM